MDHPDPVARSFGQVSHLLLAAERQMSRIDAGHDLCDGTAERKLTGLYALLENASKRIACLEEQKCVLKERAVPLRLVDDPHVDEAPPPAAQGRS